MTHVHWDRIGAMNAARDRKPATGGKAYPRPKAKRVHRSFNLQYRDCLAELQLSIVGASHILGITPRQSMRYASGETVPTPMVVRLLNMLVRYGIPDEYKPAPITTVNSSTIKTGVPF